MFLFIVLASFLSFICAQQVDINEPIAAVDYAKLVKQGFATNYFKVFPPGKKYNSNNIQDVAKRGFTNLRLRSSADLYKAPYGSSPQFHTFLNELEKVVDDCLAQNVFPIISWIHFKAEAYATDTDKQNYIEWWTLVATTLKDKDYRLSFNLFTELGFDKCPDNPGCPGSLHNNPDKYNDWTKAVVAAIKGTGGKNANRVIILASPKVLARGLSQIDPSIYTNDKYMMAEFHAFASGPNKRAGSPNSWIGDGQAIGRTNVDNSVVPAVQWSQSTGIPVYFGAWMAHDIQTMSQDQQDIENFAQYFVTTLNKYGIPWSLNVLDKYYDTKKATWLTEPQTIKAKKVDASQTINFSKVLDVIVAFMK